MTRVLVYETYDNDLTYIEAAGTSTDTKPTEGIVSGSIYTEVDTGDVYLFDEESGQWVEQFSLQG